MFWIIQTIFFSILFITVVHYLFDFFKSNLTVPIVKDLVKRPTNKYKQIYDIINTMPPPPPTPAIPMLMPSTNMKAELKNFLKEQMNRI